MPYTTTSLYLTFGGPAWQAQEEWQTGLRIPMTTPSNRTEIESFTESAASGIQAWWSSPGIPFSGAVSLAWVKCAFLGLDGRYIEEQWNPVISEIVPPVTGTAAVTVLPQSSVVVTLESGFSTGRARTGRCYLPPMTSAVPSTASGLLSQSDAEAVRDAFVGLIDDINVSIQTWLTGSESRVAIMSSLGNGTTRNVTSVRVGRVVDTQRRRRGGLPETYTASAVVDS